MLPTGPFDVILADPPWRFASNSDAKPGRNARRHYRCMSVAEIAAMPVREAAAKDSVLYLWTTAPHLANALAVLSAWGFTYKSNLAWDKAVAGTGYWARNEHEHVLIGRRGRFPAPAPADRPRSIIRGGRREHSRKPDALHDIIERAWPDARRLELFARQHRIGWTIFGDEAEKFAGAA